MVSLLELANLTRATYSRRERVGSWERRASFGLESGAFHAVLWCEESRSRGVLAVRGTANLWSALQDLRLLCGREPRAWRRGLRALRDSRTLLGDHRELILTGHSLGGAFASALAAMGEAPAAVFNAPGVRSVVPDKVRRRARGQLEVSIARDWIRQLSGRGLGRELLLGDRSEHPAVQPGPVGLMSALRRCRHPAESPVAFVRRSLRDHSMRAFEPWSKRRGPVDWHTPIQSSELHRLPWAFHEHRRAQGRPSPGERRGDDSRRPAHVGESREARSGR